MEEQSDNTIRPLAFFSRFFNDAENDYSVANQETLAVVWGHDKHRFCLYVKKEHPYTDQQALEPSIKRVKLTDSTAHD